MSARSEQEDGLSSELAHAIVESLVSNGDFHVSVRSVVDELREMGHELFSFDEDDDFEIWCADWSRHSSGPSLTIEFRRSRSVQVTWGTPAGHSVGAAGIDFATEDAGQQGDGA